MANAVKFTGAMAKANFAQEVSVWADGILQRAGTEVKNAMQEETRPYDHDGTLTKSIAWRTMRNRSNVPETAYLIDAPDVPNAVDVGSHAPYAWYREYGAGVHKTPNGAAQFMSSITAWIRDKIGVTPADRLFWQIVNSIRKGEKAQAGIQNKQPFLAPVQPKVPGILISAAQDGLTKMWNAIGKKYKV